MATQHDRHNEAPPPEGDDAEIVSLCEGITRSQKAEIDQMKKLLERY